MTKKPSPKVTVTKKHYKRLQDDAVGYKILSDIILQGCGTPTSPVEELFAIKKKLNELESEKVDRLFAIADIAASLNINDERTTGDTVSSILNNIAKTQDALMALCDTLEVPRTDLNERSMYMRLKRLLREYDKKTDEDARVIKRLKHKQRRMRDVIRAALYVNSEVAGIIELDEDKL